MICSAFYPPPVDVFVDAAQVIWVLHRSHFPSMQVSLSLAPRSTAALPATDQYPLLFNLKGVR